MGPQSALRVTATPGALGLIAELQRRRHGPVLFHQSGGYCDGSYPICFAQGDLILSDQDLRLGDVGGAPIFISALQHRAWRRTQTIINVVPGRGGMFSLENGSGLRFLARSRAFTPQELARLADRDPD